MFQSRQNPIGETARKQPKKYVNVDNLIESAMTKFMEGNIDIVGVGLIYTVKFCCMVVNTYKFF